MGQLCSKLCTNEPSPSNITNDNTKKQGVAPHSASQSQLPLLKKNHAGESEEYIQETNTSQSKELDLSEQTQKQQSNQEIKSQQPQQHNGKKEITYKDFERLQELGSGAYGDVILVKKKTNGKIFAMKIIKKAKIVERNLNPQMIIEKTVLLENSHPFLVRLKYSFQTDKKLYLVMEYCQGGELYTYLYNNKKFSVEVSRFIAAEVLLGLQYLQKNMKVIYRDLKPENILVSEDGHLKITDFGLAKHFDREDETTRTLRGTPEYIAPEVIKASMNPQQPGYGLQCDIWAFGIFVYEMISGNPPFTDPNRNWPKILNKIIENNPVFTPEFTIEAEDLIRKCLRNEPAKRPGWDEIKSHSFFRNIEWDLLLKKGIESPLKKLVPKRNGAHLQRPKPINETITNEAFEEFSGFTYDPSSFVNIK